ncbi:MAG: LysE family translocator [Chloroflexi bacterium]|nr:MAG: LysE family translocator [Chloroflexota bacterium]
MASLLIRGFALGFAIAASPGPIFFLCLRRSLLRGWLTGLVSGLGVATADAFYAAVAVFGVAAVVTTTLAPVARWLALAGGLALVFIGIRAVVSSPATREATTSTTRTGLAWAYTSILGLTITNPATIISFAALAATLGLGTGGSFARPALVVVGVLLGSAAWWCILVIGASLLRARLTPQVVGWISTVSGLAIAVLGILAVISAFSG